MEGDPQGPERGIMESLGISENSLTEVAFYTHIYISVLFFYRYNECFIKSTQRKLPKSLKGFVGIHKSPKQRQLHKALGALYIHK